MKTKKNTAFHEIVTMSWTSWKCNWKSELEVLDFNSNKCLEELQKMYTLATNSISKALLNHTVKGISFLSDDITSVQDLQSAT